MLPLSHHNNLPWLIALITISSFFTTSLTAQTIHKLPPGQPEQDACTALRLCGTSFYTPYSYSGKGKKSDLTSTPCYPTDGGGEQDVVWLRLDIDKDGKLEFKIMPVNPYDDYDFAVLKTTACDSLTPDSVVRCNFNNNLPGSNPNGVIGLSTSSTLPFVEMGSLGNSFCQAIDAKAGETYLVMINNFGNYANPNSASAGFKIDFTGSTTTFNKPDPPVLSSIDMPCQNITSITVNVSDEVLCNSIAADGSDFSVDAPVAITSAAGINCSGSTGYTNKVVLTFSSALPAGSYTLGAKTGTDGNTLVNLCGIALALPSAGIPFTIAASGKKTTVNEAICYSQLPYVWNGITLTKGGNDVAEYTTSSAGGCDSTTVLNLTVSTPADSISSAITICAGQSYALPWDSTVTTAGTFIHTYTNTAGCDSLVAQVTISVHTMPQINTTTGFCKDSSVVLSAGEGFTAYQWSTGATQASIVVKEQGFFTVIVKDTTGCTVTDTFNVQAYPVPTAAFNRQMALCDTISLIADAGNSFTSYLWSDGSTAQTIRVSSAGKYWVTITDQYSCRATDTVTVFSYSSPSGFLVPEIIKCFYDDAVVTPSHPFMQYNWSNGNMGKQVEVHDPGIYWLDATDAHGCTGRDSVVVTDSACKIYVYIPTAFTPNADGKNDIFKPIVAGKLTHYFFTVYDRWGKQVFKTKDVSLGWNGNASGLQQPAGTYIWICEYQLTGQEAAHSDKGTITLIR